VGVTSAGTVGLQLVPVEAGTTQLGLTNRAGWLNATTYQSGQVTFQANAYGFYSGRSTVTVAPTGVTPVGITLNAEPPPKIIIEVLGRSIGGLEALLKGASVNVSSVNFLPTGPYLGNFTTGSGGTVTLTPPVGNYTMRASAPGYVQNSSGGLLIALSGQQYVRTIYLQPIGFSNLTVLVLSSVPTHPVIGGASVGLNFTTLNLTDGQPYAPMSRTTTAHGWANFSGIPAATVVVTASAPGYYSNKSTLVLAYDPAGNAWTMYLTPLPPAPYAGLRILPANTLTLWALAALPLAAALGVLVYLTMLRTPSLRERDEERRSALPGTPGDPGKGT
jgi:hypothetical protein